MARRLVKFRNYRNIGVSKDEGKFERLSLNSSLEKENIGELIIVIGENNVGKSNILDGIAAIKPPESGSAPLSKSDKPDFMDFDDGKPEIRLVYDGVDEKSYDAGWFLDDAGNAQFATSLELVDKAAEIQKRKRQLTQESRAAIDKEFNAKFNAFPGIIRDYCRFANGTQEKDLAALKKRYNSILADPEGIDEKSLKDVYWQLDELLNKIISSTFVECSSRQAKKPAGMPDRPSSQIIKKPEFLDLDSIISYKDETMPIKVPKDVIKEKCGIRLVPQIVYYKEEEIKDRDFTTTPEAVKDSKFFASLLKAAGKSIDTITQAYEKAKKAPAYKKKFKDIINEALNEKVSKKFNDLYFHGTLTQEYNFEIELNKDEIYLYMGKNGDIISLSRQSTGFRWFFNFFFNFLYAADLQAGDIVLMDEPDAHLAIPAKRELRRF